MWNGMQFTNNEQWTSAQLSSNKWLWKYNEPNTTFEWKQQRKIEGATKATRKQHKKNWPPQGFSLISGNPLW